MKSGFAALAGRPNVGKSTLMNSLIGQKIAITSGRPQTTRDRIETVYTDERGQIIFIDTPGIHKAKNKLGLYMDSVAEKTFGDADVILWLVEPECFSGAGEELIAEMLGAAARAGHKVVLVVNKADLLGGDKEKLDKVLAFYGEKLPFAGTAAVSAKTGEGTEELLSLLFGLLPEGPLYYDEETVTLIPMREIASELIREQALEALKDEVPHGIAVVIERFSERKNGLFDIEASIVCERESHKGMVIGKGGAMIKRIGTGARLEIEKQLEARVNLKLFVKVRKNWRDSEVFMKSFGYDLSARK